MSKVILNESGYETGESFDSYAARAAQHGDNPKDYSSVVDDFVFVGKDYAKLDPSWGDPGEEWPDDLPLWEYRPA